jgi:hypothetical protein
MSQRQLVVAHEVTYGNASGESAELNREYSNKPTVQNVRSSAETPTGEQLIRPQGLFCRIANQNGLFRVAFG